MSTYTYTLPWPPSVNTLWRAVRGRNILSKRGREFYEDGQRVLLPQPRPSSPLLGRVSVTITLLPPTRRGYDIDNRTKAVLDLLTKAGIWADDEQVTRLLVEKGEVTKGGAAVVTVEARP